MLSESQTDQVRMRFIFPGFHISSKGKTTTLQIQAMLPTCKLDSNVVHKLQTKQTNKKCSTSSIMLKKRGGGAEQFC